VEFYVLAAGGSMLVAGGLFMKWAVLPVLVAFELGRAVERVRHGRKAPAR
jgi:hypothetical protein